ncbi:MAG: antitoxin ParD1/3/4 [Thermomicrobiales bacterium]|jgi:putative addiction module CopG family antidote|nr:antitoxin ParD1/3/4 [Thermomicrobiales bacterium]
MIVRLDTELEAVIQQKVATGLYPDSDEVVRQALRLLDEHDRIEQLRARLDVGLEQVARGKTMPFTPELVEHMKRDARHMAEAGLKPNPDVCP